MENNLYFYSKLKSFSISFNKTYIKCNFCLTYFGNVYTSVLFTFSETVRL